MKTSRYSSGNLCLAVAAVFILSLAPSSHGLGSGATLAISDASATVCGVVAGESTRRIECYRQGQVVPIVPDVSFSSISGGRDYFCGLRSSNSNLFCWSTTTSSFDRKRLYNDSSVPLENLAVGDTHVCATVVGGGTVRCWRTGDTFQRPSGSDQFASISSGYGFSCGILKNGFRVRCWGDTDVSNVVGQIENAFGNMSMLSLVAGGSYVCGLNSTGFLVCGGSSSSGQLDYPPGGAFEYGGLALGAKHGCAIRGLNGSVVCWGGNGEFSVNVTEGVSFEVIVSGSNFVCGLTTNNLTVVCWGPGWSNSSSFELPLPRVLPGPCVQSSCGECGSYLDSQSLCSGSNNICKPMTCRPQPTVPPPPSPSPSPPPSPSESPPPPPPLPLSPPSSSRSKTLTRGLLAFAIIGSVGGFAGICTIVYCLWTGVCFGKKKVHNSVQPTITRGSSGSNGGGASNNSGSSFGVVSLELLSGHKAIHKNENGLPRNVVDFVVPFIAQDEIHTASDQRVPPPTPFELVDVEFVGYLAADCVGLEGRDRPTMSQAVNNLERAFCACVFS
ncbi:putative serine/threonine-protein kinase protein CCR3 [Spatholobus suberectus]|nr:putative serine/threonine-protein kinase protein CCR3 [Spatholobus suberectus]